LSVEDNTSDSVSSLFYPKEFKLDDVFSSPSYYKSFKVDYSFIFPDKKEDVKVDRDYYIFFTDDIKKTKKLQENEFSQKRVNGNLRSSLFINHYFYSTNFLRLYNDFFYENISIESAKDKILLSNETEVKVNNFLGLYNYSLFNYGDKKIFFTENSFYQNINKVRLGENLIFEYDIKNNSYKAGTFFSINFNNFFNKFEFYFDNLKYIFGTGFGVKFDYIDFIFSNNFETDFSEIFKFNFNLKLNFVYEEILTFKLIKADNRFKSPIFRGAKEVVEELFDKNIEDISLTQFKIKKDIFSFELISAFYSKLFFLSIDLNKIPNFIAPDFFTKILIGFDFKKFVFLCSNRFELINFKTFVHGARFEFNGIKINFIDLSFGYDFNVSVENTLNKMENRFFSRVDFNVFKFANIFIKADFGLGIDKISEQSSFNFLYSVELGYKSYF